MGMLGAITFVASQAQTKEETMQWIASKINDYAKVIVYEERLSEDGHWSYSEIRNPNTNEFISYKVTFVGDATNGVKMTLDLSDISSCFTNDGNISVY